MQMIGAKIRETEEEHNKHFLLFSIEKQFKSSIRHQSPNNYFII